MASMMVAKEKQVLRMSLEQYLQALDEHYNGVHTTTTLEIQRVCS